MESNTVMKLVRILFLISSFIQGNSYSFKIGETLKYDAHFRGIYAANAKLEVIGKEKVNNHMTYHVEFTARSRGIITDMVSSNIVCDWSRCLLSFLFKLGFAYLIFFCSTWIVCLECSSLGLV